MTTVYLISLVTDDSDVGGFEWRYNKGDALKYVADNADISWYVGPVAIPDAVTDADVNLNNVRLRSQSITTWLDTPGSAAFALWNGKVRRDENGAVVERWATCGTCGREWNDAIISSITPTPSGRCPFEYEHDADEGDDEPATLSFEFGNGTKAVWSFLPEVADETCAKLVELFGEPPTLLC